jgi:hypothetical protein
MRVYAEAWPVADIISKIGSGEIDSERLFGTNGDNGLVIQTGLSHLRTSNDGTRVILKTNSGQENRVAGVSDPVAELTSKADSLNINYVVYSAVPCVSVFGIYLPLTDSHDWEGSALQNIYNRLDDPEWVPIEE